MVFGQGDHRWDAAAAGAGQPGIQVRIGVTPGGEPVQVAELLFQRPGAEQHMAGAAEPVKELLLGGGQAAGVFQQCPAGVLDQVGGGVGADASAGAAEDAASAAGGVPLDPADLVHGVGGQLDHVERVGAHPDLRGVGTGDLGVGAVQVHGGRLQLSCSCGAEVGEEPLEGGAGLAFADPTTAPWRSWSATTVR